MKKYIPHFITILGLVSGCVGLYFVSVGRAEPTAFVFVLIAAFFDVMDGLVARKLQVSSELGKQLDSLADLVSFGVLPSFYLLYLMHEKTSLFWLALAIVIFSALRLAIFNIDETQKECFRGLPTPANAIMITSLVYLEGEVSIYLLMGLPLFSSLLLIAPFRLIALKFNSYAWRGNEEKWTVIIGVVLMVALFSRAAFPFVIPYYLGVSFFTHFFKK